MSWWAVDFTVCSASETEASLLGALHLQRSTEILWRDEFCVFPVVWHLIQLSFAMLRSRRSFIKHYSKYKKFDTVIKIGSGKHLVLCEIGKDVGTAGRLSFVECIVGNKQLVEADVPERQRNSPESFFPLVPQLRTRLKTSGHRDGQIWTGQTFSLICLIWIQTLVHQVIKSRLCL